MSFYIFLPVLHLSIYQSHQKCNQINIMSRLSLLFFTPENCKKNLAITFVVRTEFLAITSRYTSILIPERTTDIKIQNTVENLSETTAIALKTIHKWYFNLHFGMQPRIIFSPIGFSIFELILVP